MKVRFKLKYTFFKTEYVIVEIPDDDIVIALDLKNIEELDLSDDGEHRDIIFDFTWNEMEIEDFEILNSVSDKSQEK